MSEPRSRPRLTREVFRFVAAGAVNTVAGLSAIAVGQSVLSLGPYWANAFGYAVGLACSYALNSRWTFRAGVGSPGRMMRFVLAFGLAYGANLAALYGLLEAQAPWLLAQGMSLLLYSVLFFLLCRYVVFRRPDESPSAPAPRR